MIDIFSHDVSVKVDPEAEDIYIISGKTWENEAFNLYVNQEEARNIVWQLNFFLED